MENNHLLNNRLPYGNAKLFLGIASIIVSPLILGFVFGVISVYLADKDTQMLKSYPNNYSNSAVGNHKQGVILAWVGFIVSFAVTAIIIYLFYTYGTVDFAKIKQIKAATTGK